MNRDVSALDHHRTRFGTAPPSPSSRSQLEGSAKCGDPGSTRSPTPSARGSPKSSRFFIRVGGVDAPAYVHTRIKTSPSTGGIYLREEAYRTSSAPISDLAEREALCA